MANASIVAAVVLFLLGAAPVSGGILETTTGGLVAYQADAGTHHDAPDTCAQAVASAEAFDLPVGGSVRGLLVAVEDEIDHYRVAVGQEFIGGRITIYARGFEATLPIGVDVSVPGCGTSVTASENQPTPESERPQHPAPAAGEKQVSPSQLKDGSPDACGGEDWKFVLNQFGDMPAPASLHGIWTDGTAAEIPQVKQTKATVVHYATSYNTGILLESVTANVPLAWTGQFNSVHGPCGAVDGGAVYGEPAQATQQSVTFTPIAAGTYTLQVHRVDFDLNRTVPSSVPVSCHGVCAGLIDGGNDLAGYDAFFDDLAAS